MAILVELSISMGGTYWRLVRSETHSANGSVPWCDTTTVFASAQYPTKTGNANTVSWSAMVVSGS